MLHVDIRPCPHRHALRGRIVVENDGNVDRRVLRPVEIQLLHGHVARPERNSDRRRYVGQRGLPACRARPVDSAEGELPLDEVRGGSNGAALRDIALQRLDVPGAVGYDEGVPGGDGEGLFSGEGVATWADDDRDTGGYERGVRVSEVATETAEGCMCLVGGRGDGVALPVERAVFEIGDLRRERGVYV
jgi:hypothetical protein